MLQWMKWLVPVVALGVAGVWSGALGADKVEGRGSIQVTVKDKDGKAVAEAGVRLFKAEGKRDGRTEPLAKGGKLKGQRNEGEKAKGDKQKGENAKVVAEGRTDAAGLLTLADIVPGEYRLVAGHKGEGRGQGKVVVEANKVAEVTLTLVPKADRGK